MASPVYGKQYIRFAETGHVGDGDSIPQFHVVKIDNSVLMDPPHIIVSDGGESFGVLQQDVDAVDIDKATTAQRLGTVATSGLLLVAANGASMPTQNANLEVDGNGVAVAVGAGAEVTIGRW